MLFSILFGSVLFSVFLWLFRHLLLLRVSLRPSFPPSKDDPKDQRVPTEFISHLTRDPSSIVAISTAMPLHDCKNMSESFIVVFSDAGALHMLFEALLKEEIANCCDSTTLLRGNSFVTFLLSKFAMMCGGSILACLREPYTRVCSLAIDSTELYEVDPGKMQPEWDVESNRRRMCDIVVDFIQCIAGSAENTSTELKQVCQLLHQSIVEKFPSCGYKSLAGFLFLRLICPAMLTGAIPDVPTPTRTSRRVLILITKVLQNVASNVKFGHKESHMECFNSLLDAQRPIIMDYFDAILVPPKEEGWRISSSIASMGSGRAKSSVYQYVRKSATIRKELPPEVVAWM